MYLHTSAVPVCNKTFIFHLGDHVFVAVKKQANLQARTTQFTDTELLHVLPPTSKRHHYTVDPEEEIKHPLFDSSHMVGLLYHTK